MSDDLRARILEALNTAPVAEIRDDPQWPAEQIARPWRRHDKHNYHAFCALCQGEAGTLADAVMAVLAELAPVASAEPAADELISTSQAAELVGVTRATMVRFLEDGRLPYTQPGKHRRLRLADVHAFKASITTGCEVADA